MPVFSTIQIDYNGTTYEIPDNEVLDAIARIEKYINYRQLSVWIQSGNWSDGALALAYYEALCAAGARNITREEVYDSLFEGDAAISAMSRMYELMAILIPPKRLQGGTDTKKPATAD